MLSQRWAKALASGAFVLASITMIMFVASVLAQNTGFSWGKKTTQLCMPGMRGGCNAPLQWESVDGYAGSAPSVAIESSPVALPAPTDRSLMFQSEAVESDMMMGGSVMNTERKVSTTGSVDLRAKSLDWTVSKIREIVKNAGGFIENATLNQPEQGIKSAWMTVKVPADRFEAALAEIKQTADQVVNENTGATDFTAQSIDLNARLNNKRAEEKAYESLLSSATKVADVVEITQELTRVRTEIESLEQQHRYLEAQTALATLSVSVTEDPRVQANPGEFQRGNIFKSSLNTLVDALLALGSGLVVFLISGLPILLIVLGLIWIVYRTARRVVGRMFGE
ncbi:DUF4349 domain-containing protein [Candidatus Dojkabacteria bacterium]|uniref:DUF4349 domain-containing protein n=1 Tax=Candidatus Dojkabacteria bacterium TaxID=2099670 RepID=A0A5C7J7X8_9BACT|nr:MAG: DUF4349 domain-containing protein [Candidatus Dojkabacteria bacterium]